MKWFRRLLMRWFWRWPDGDGRLVELADRDILVLLVPQQLSRQSIDDIRNKIARLELKNRVLVMDAGMDFAVLRRPLIALEPKGGVR